jgi:hypothetical protein
MLYECGAVVGMRIGIINRSTQRNPAPVPLRQPHISCDMTWYRTVVAAVGYCHDLWVTIDGVWISEWIY